MAQGFIRILNLSESDTVSKDRNSINNLGGTGIATDLQLLSNNILNKTVIAANTYTVDGDYVVLDTSVYQIAMSNRTKVTHDNQTLTVVNSNGVDRFQLESSDNIIITPNNQIDIVRSDAATLKNLKNLIRGGIPTDQTAAAQSDDDSSIGVGEGSVILGTESANNERLTLSQQFGYIEDVIDNYRYDRNFSIITDIGQFFDRRIEYRSTITITNDANILLPTIPGAVDNAPGIFVASDAGASRAFSNNNNPWSDTVIGSGYTQTTSSRASISTLIMTDPDLENLSTSAVLPSDVLNDFTHKIAALINGETYYLLCSNN